MGLSINFKYFIAICLIIIFYIFIISYLENTTYENLNGEEPNNTSKNYVYFMKSKYNKNALDNFRLGAVYLFHYKDLRNANFFFKESLKKINKGDNKDAVFIFDKLRDYEVYFLDCPEMNDLNLQGVMTNYYIDKSKKLKRMSRHPQPQTQPQPQSQPQTQPQHQSQPQIIPQKIILSNKKWTSDSQNVHDSSLHNEFKNQLLEVINENQRMQINKPNMANNINKSSMTKNLNDLIDSLDSLNVGDSSTNNVNVDTPSVPNKSEFSDIINFYKNHYKNNRDNMEKLSKVLINLEPNNAIHVNNLREQDVITAVWQRANDERNRERCDNIRESLGECILDCVDKSGSVVCLAGRTSRYWQALANLDFSPEMGILQTKQAVRNEIYEKCASIVHTELRNKELMDYYISGSSDNPKLTADLNDALFKINKSIDSLEVIYKDKLPDKDLQIILNECKTIL